MGLRAPLAMGRRRDYDETVRADTRTTITESRTMESLKRFEGAAGTVAEFVAIPGMAERVREGFYRDAVRQGLSEFDADDAAQSAFIQWMKSALPPVHAFYSVRKYMRRSRYAGTTGMRRQKNRKLLEPVGETNERLRGGQPDNPVAIVAAIETVHLACMAAAGKTGRGRTLRQLRSMSEGDVRSLLCPDMRGVSEREPVPATFPKPPAREAYRHPDPNLLTDKPARDDGWLSVGPGQWRKLDG